jgi:hypothetical protein
MARGTTQGRLVRLKLVAVGIEKLLLVRFVGLREAARAFGDRPRQSGSADRWSFDGEIWRIQGAGAIASAVQFLRESWSPVYDPNLHRDLPALPDPWGLAQAERRNWNEKPTVYMARVWHERMAESLAFQLPGYDDDFIIELRRRFGPLKEWREYRKDLQVWIIADHYEPLAHELLDAFYRCCWDPLFGGDEWNVLPPLPGTQYPVRTLDDGDFRTLGVAPGCAIWEIHAAYRDRKDDYNNNRIDGDEWFEVDTAFQRIDRYYRPDPEEELPDQVAAPRAIVLLLRQIFPGEPERVIWYYRHQDVLGGVPHELALTAEGEAQVGRCLELMRLLRVKQPAP